MRRRERDVNKLEHMAPKENFSSDTEGDNGYLVNVPNTRKMVALRDVIVKESEVGSIPDNTETPDLLDEGSPLLKIWHPDGGHQEDYNKEEQGTSTAIKEEWRDAESVNTQEKTLIRDTSDVEEAALDEKSTATIGSLRDSEWLQDSDTEVFSVRDSWPFWKIKWVYKVKLGPGGQVDKYKARYMAKGFKKMERLDYFETFAPTRKP